jgi:hypothetical protein
MRKRASACAAGWPCFDDGQIAAYHQPRHRLWRFLRRDASACHLAAAQYCGRMAQLLDFIELVADVENAAAFGGELTQRLEQFAHRLRGQHRGRFIHDQQTRTLQQAADDFDALALADRQGVDQPARIDRQPVALRDRLDLFRERGQVRRFGQGQRHILDDGEGLEQRKVLEHHPDAQAACMRGIVDGELLAFPDHRALGGLGHPVDDLHQRRLARAVFPQHGMYLARSDFQVDAVVGDHRRVDLAYAAQFQSRSGGSAGPACSTGASRAAIHSLPSG